MHSISGNTQTANIRNKSKRRNTAKADTLPTQGRSAQEIGMTIHDENRPVVHDQAAGNLLLWASGFGLGAMVVLLGFVLLIGVHVVGRDAPTGGSPQVQSSAPAAPQTTGQAPAPSASPPAR